MKNVYANLLGEWQNLSADPNCVIGTNHSDPNTWWREEGHELFNYDYINLHFRGQDFRIHPSFIQIVTDKN
ncbi:hypothetical protein DDJ96_11765 [Enterococcus mundtii]|nr:hypothetical protein DDJ96_11765 [Enterococcus mundtii]